jgi:DNA-binding NarL/FixJ family response regulator
MQRLRVLVADDFEEMRLLVTRVLSQHYAIVGSVADGEALVSAANILRPCVIVSDIGMPFLTGPEAIRELRARGLKIPVVLMSANMTDPDEHIEAGAIGLIDKVDIGHELIRAVRSASNGSIYLSRHVRASMRPDSRIAKNGSHFTHKSEPRIQAPADLAWGLKGTAA